VAAGIYRDFLEPGRGPIRDYLVTRRTAAILDDAGSFACYGFEFKYSDAPRTTRSMRIALADLCLDRLFVVYPGERQIELDERITALPLAEVGNLHL
jgi:hypothetical protein